MNREGSRGAVGEYIEELRKIAKETEKGIEEGLKALEKVSARMCSTLARETEDVREDAKRIARSVLEDVRRETPKLEKDFDEMLKKLRSRIRSIEEELDKRL